MLHRLCSANAMPSHTGKRDNQWKRGNDTVLSSFGLHLHQNNPHRFSELRSIYIGPYR